MRTEQELIEIASTHLGKKGGYCDTYSPELLVRIPREINRSLNGIDDANPGFTGYDVWNCYEVSALTSKGLPVACYAKIIIPAESIYHVESKSLKLYLNSFNMTRLGGCRKECLDLVRERIATDLSSLLECNVSVHLFGGMASLPQEIAPVNSLEDYPDLESLIPSQVVDNMEFNDYNSNPELLRTMDLEQSLQHNGLVRFKCDLLRSNCRITHQPDWGTLYVALRGDVLPELESCLRYVVSHRSVYHFHEEICEMIYKHLNELCQPKELMVACCYTRRGGIDINPIRSSSPELIPQEFICPDIPLAKTPRQ